MIKVIIAFIVGVWFGVTMSACIMASRDRDE